MQIEGFELERTQSLYENQVAYNLTESGVHPYTLDELLSPAEKDTFLGERLGYGQTNGSVELRNTLRFLYPGTSIDNILVTNGSSEANFIAMWSLLNPGDEILLMQPNYQQILGLVRSFGVTVKPIWLREDDRWRLDMDTLWNAVGPKTRIIAVCNPNNPTGAVLTKDEMREIIDLARSHDAWIYSDEVYRGAELDGPETPSFWGTYDKVLVTGGLSKAYGMPGLRLGWLVGPEQAIETAWGYRDYTSISSGILSQWIASLILQPERRKTILQRSRRLLTGNLHRLEAWISEFPGMLKMIPPRAGGIACIRTDIPFSSRVLAHRLRLEMDVFIMEGEVFGMENYIRIGIGGDPVIFSEGLVRIGDFLRTLS